MFLFVPLTRLHCYELNTCLMIIFFFEPFPIGYFHWNGTFSNRYWISILKANTHTHSHLINSINLNTREKKKQSKQNKRKLGSPFRLFCSNLFSVMFCRILATVYITCFPTLSLTLSHTTAAIDSENVKEKQQRRVWMITISNYTRLSGK